MRPQKRNPAAWRADRASNVLILLAEPFEDNPTPLNIQARSLERRFGFNPSFARLVASLVFMDARA